jgi:deoxyribonuclease-1
MNVEFRYMESELYNLVPAVGEINGLRSNYSFAMIIGEKREFSTRDEEIENRKAEPRPEGAFLEVEDERTRASCNFRKVCE